MIALQLYVDNQLVEMFDDESVTLTQAIQDVRDIEKIFSDFSKTFTVPASETNNKIFKHFYNFEIVDGFDARKRVDAELYLNYRLFKKGKLKLEGSTLKINKAHTYKLTFFGNTVNLKDKIGEAVLADLPMLTNFSFQYTDANIKALMNTPSSHTMSGVVFPDSILVPLITHTKRLIYNSSSSSANTDTTANVYYSGSGHGVEVGDLKPAIRVHAIIKAIEKKFFLEDGFSFSKDFFTTSNPSYYRLFLWLHNKTGGLFDDQPEQVKFENITKTGTGGDKGNRTVDLYNNYFKHPSRLATGSVSRRRQRRWRFSITTTNQSAVYTIYVYQDGKEIESYKDLTGDQFPRDYKAIEQGAYTVAVESSAVATFTIHNRVEWSGTFGAQSLAFTATASTLANKKLQITEQLPNIKIIDFLTGIFKMFNLTAFIQDDKKIKIQTLDKFYSTNTEYRDVTEFVDKESSIVDSVLPYKQINFKYKGEDSFLANNFQQISNRKWGALSYAQGEKLAGEDYTVELPFDHFMFERLKNVNGGANTGVQWGWSVDGKQQPFVGEPLLFYPVLQSATTAISFLDSSSSASSLASYYIPSNSLQIDDNLFNQDTSDNINFNAETNEYQGTVYKKSLFEKYYKTYIEDVFDIQRRLTKVKAYLPVSVLQELTLADKLVIFNKVYKINKIVTNFETLLSDLELINTTSESIPIIPSKFLPVDVPNLSADSTTLTVDDGAVTVDSYNNIEGLQIISTTEVVPEDVAVSNTPHVIQKDVALVVTPPNLTYLKTAETSSTVSPSFTVTTLGKVGSTPQIDEYGFFYSATRSHLNSTDIATLKAGSATNIKYNTTPANKNYLSGNIIYQITGLSAGDDIYYRFYGITTTDTSFDVSSGEMLSPILAEKATPSISYTTTTQTYLYNVQSADGSQRGDGNTTFRIKNGDGTYFDVKGFSGPSLFSYIIPVVIEGDSVTYEQMFYGGSFTGISTHNSSQQFDGTNSFDRELESCGFHTTTRLTAEEYSKASDSTEGATLTNGHKLTRLAFYNQGNASESTFAYQMFRPLKEGFGLMQLTTYGVYQENDESNKLLYAEDGFYAFYDSDTDGKFAPGQGVSAQVVNGIVTKVQTYY